MGRVLVMNHVSLDGVMQAPGRADEDRRDGFDRGGWAIADDAGSEAMAARMQAGGGLAGWLFGRRTYEDVLGHWTQQQDSAFGAALAATPKYVASRTLGEPPPWPHTTLLHGDIPQAVASLKDTVDGVLVMMGSGQLIDALLPHDLIDEFLLLINPIVLGGGRRMFPDGSPYARLRCLDASLTPQGLVLATYARG